jgi:hypothetical protein
MPFKERQPKAREDLILMRVVTVVLILTAAAFTVMIFMIIAAHS